MKTKTKMEEEEIEKQVETTLRESIQQELKGNTSPQCAQALINSV